MSSAKQTQRDLLLILDRMSISVTDCRVELGAAIANLIDSHQALAGTVMIQSERIESLEQVVLSLVRVQEAQAVLLQSMVRGNDG